MRPLMSRARSEADETAAGAPPLNWVDPANAGLVVVGGKTASVSVGNAFPRDRVICVSGDSAPWQSAELIGFLEQREARQIIVYAETTHAVVRGIAMLALGSGYDTFLVAGDLESLSPGHLIRLQQIGVRRPGSHEWSLRASLVSTLTGLHP